jgi:hypothetical protein
MLLALIVAGAVPLRHVGAPGASTASRRSAPADSCLPDTAGRWDTTRISLGLAPAGNASSASGPRADYLLAAQAIRSYFRPPRALTLPFWAHITARPDSQSTKSDIPGLGFAGSLAFRLDPLGHLVDTTVFVDTAAPELNESLIAAVRRADSALGFSPPGRAVRRDKGHILLRFVNLEKSSGPAVPLVRVAVPTIRADSDVSIRKIPQPVFPVAGILARTSGTVELQYVVTAEGRADPASFKVLHARYREFVDAAIRAIAAGSFYPARLRGCAVPMLVVQKVSFTFQ